MDKPKIPDDTSGEAALERRAKQEKEFTNFKTTIISPGVEEREA